MQHLAIIPDGNRRWAKKQVLESIFGHRKGLDAVKSAVDACIKHAIPHLSIYTFSLENFNRSEYEKSYLFKMICNLFDEHLKELLEKGVKIRFCGDRSLFPDSTKEAIANIELASAECKKLTLNLLFCYGGRQELVAATKAIAQEVAQGKLTINEISQESLAQHLWTWPTPDPELIIRTAGTSRLSGFLLFQSAYSEIMVVNDYWPEMTTIKIEACLEKFQGIQRNFGH